MRTDGSFYKSLMGFWPNCQALCEKQTWHLGHQSLHGELLVLCGSSRCLDLTFFFFFLTVLLCFAVSEFSRKSRYITNIKSPILLDKVSILVSTSSVNAGEEWKHLQAPLQENMVLRRFCANVVRAMMSVKGSNLITHLPHTPHWIRIISNCILQKFFGIWWVILDCCQNCLNCPLLVLDLVGLFSAADPTKLQKPS